MVHAAIANPNNARNSFFCKNRGGHPPFLLGSLISPFPLFRLTT